MKKFLLVLVIAAIALSGLVVITGCNDTDEDFKVGVIHINPTSSTSGYTYAHEQGILYMQRELGLKDSQIIRKDSVDDTNAAAINTAIDELVAEGANIIFGTSFGYGEPMRDKAAEYPDVIFSHGTGGYSNATNLNNYFGRIYQARYLSGLVAGMKAEQGGKIGYVAAHGNYIAELSSGINAFALGAQAVNPTVTVEVMTMGSWYDPVLEGDHARALIDNGATVIAQHCDTEQPALAAKNANVFAIGYNSDMSKTEAGNSVLTSVVWNWGVYYKVATQAAMDGKWEEFDREYFGDFSDGLFDLAPFSSEVDSDTKAIVNLVKAKFNDANDSWDVFSGKVLSFDKDDDGNWTVAETVSALKKADGTNVGTVTDLNIKADMPYWIQGVSDTTPQN
ncbi:MAG: BMP family ABC transporter substrate-binding protein [Clostridia bacterium]